ncbi:hypothetical protein Poli38472_014153 [Pythium oligandrum]|uniref:Uncharacterized protein n=1 Tax=Pythium oligandrum TaxID=41045 RepID=A0A8K1FIN9_PYTOL|nr:hypothetical protein Poli38472_014153 [Pythium oligandrum]|eukprot:TMW64036.1 hypothetical protein Poli38472_014153 [Pythium oligandrum]
MRRSARKQHATAVPAEDVGKSKAKKERKTTKGKRKSRDEESEPHELEETQTTPRTSETSGVSVVDGGASVSAYVASCREKLHVLRERKQEQEQRTEVIVQETFGQIEAIINALMTTVQTGYTSARTHFDETSGQLEEGLDVHEQVESKLHAITAILLGSTE